MSFQPAEKKYKVKFQIPLYRTELHDKPEDDGESGFVLRQSAMVENRETHHVHTFVTSSEDVKQDWMMNLLTGMKEMHVLQGSFHTITRFLTPPQLLLCLFHVCLLVDVDETNVP